MGEQIETLGAYAMRSEVRWWWDNSRATEAGEPAIHAYLVTEIGGGNPHVVLPDSEELQDARWHGMPITALVAYRRAPASGKELNEKAPQGG
jgi:hypothetical protein